MMGLIVGGILDLYGKANGFSTLDWSPEEPLEHDMGPESPIWLN